jgi:plastocyanin domain-containing protein
MTQLTRLLATGALCVLLAACGERTDRTGGETGAMQGAPPAHSAEEGQMQDGVQVVNIRVGPTGYRPDRIVLQEGVPARLVFHRTDDSVCTEQVQIPEFGISKTDLRQNQDVALEFTPDRSGEFTFACGMDMLSGTLIVRS